MIKQIGITALLGMASLAFAQQPTITPNGIVNSASFTFEGLPGGDIAQGSLFALFGSNLGPAAGAVATTYPLPTSLSGVSLKVTSGSTVTTPIISSASAGQINAILPSNTPTGAASITVTYNGQTSAPISFNVAASSFGTYASNASGQGPGIIADADSKVFTATTAANPGNAAVIWGTGLGAVGGNEAGGALPGDMTSIPVEVFVGTTKATVTYRGRSGCCAAVDQITFTVPSATLGCHVPVTLKINNSVSNSTTMPIAATGSRTCSDAGGPSATDLQKYSTNGASVGGIALTRASASVNVPGFGNIVTNVDIGAATFEKYSPAQLNLSPNPFNVSTLGGCTVTFSKGSSSTTADPALPTYLDAGSAITVSGTGGTKQLTKTTTAGVSTYSGSLNTPGSTAAGYLEPGTFTISGPGGADIGAFMSAVTVFPALTWTNMNNITTVNRGKDLLITFSGGDPNGSVLIAGSSSTGSGANALNANFTCFSSPRDGQFTIPAAVLLSLPPSAVVSGVATGGLIVGGVSAPKSFTASGLDSGVIVSTSETVTTVTYQ